MYVEVWGARSHQGVSAVCIKSLSIVCRATHMDNYTQPELLLHLSEPSRSPQTWEVLPPPASHLPEQSHTIFTDIVL